MQIEHNEVRSITTFWDKEKEKGILRIVQLYPEVREEVYTLSSKYDISDIDKIIADFDNTEPLNKKQI